jgi:thymidylate kinase
MTVSSKPLYVIMEGLSGAGKTSICQRLAEHLGASYWKSLVSDTAWGTYVRSQRTIADRPTLDVLYMVDLLADEIRIRDLLGKQYSVVRDKSHINSLAHQLVPDEGEPWPTAALLDLHRELAGMFTQPDLVVVLETDRITALAAKGASHEMNPLDRSLLTDPSLYDRRQSTLRNLAHEVYGSAALHVLDRTEMSLEATVQRILALLGSR